MDLGRPCRTFQPLTKRDHIIPLEGNPSKRCAAPGYMSGRNLFYDHRQLSSVGFHDLANPHRTGIVFRRKPGDRNLLARVERILCPPGSHQMVGAGEFSLPLCDRAVACFTFRKTKACGFANSKAVTVPVTVICLSS